MVTLAPDPMDDLSEYGEFSQAEEEEIRSAVKEIISASIENNQDQPSFEVMDENDKIIEKPAYEAEVGEKIVYWPTNMYEIISSVSTVDEDSLREYFNGGYGVGFVIED